MELFQNLLIVMVVVWVMGKVFRLINLPVIFGELIGGILVGPLVFNVINPADPTIKILAELGVFFLMLHAGLETDPHELAKGSRKAILIAILGVMIPMTAAYFACRYFGFTNIQSIFVGMAISVTSIAMSFRILKDYKLHNTAIGHTILSSAIIEDMIILIGFSTLLTVVETGNLSILGLLVMLVKILLFFAAVIIGGLKLQKYMGSFFKDKGFTFTLIVALFLGLLAEAIGLHSIIGAFLGGLFIRQEIMDKRVFDKIEDRIYGLSYSFLGPIFFTSLAFNLSLDGFINSWKIFLALLFIAFFGKFFGSTLGAYIQKMPKPKAILAGILMNGRGALDLVIISVAFQKGIIDEKIFSVLVALAFTATMFTILATKIKVKRLKARAQ